MGFDLTPQRLPARGSIEESGEEIHEVIILGRLGRRLLGHRSWQLAARDSFFFATEGSKVFRRGELHRLLVHRERTG